MPYARIKMAAFESRETMEKTLSKLRNDIKSVFPQICAFVEVRTSEASGLTISVCDDKEAADRALAQRDKHHEYAGLEDIFAYSGTVGAFYIEEEQLGHLLKSGSCLRIPSPERKISTDYTVLRRILCKKDTIGFGYARQIV